MRLSVQLFTLRDALAADLEGTLAAIKAMGLEYVELAGTCGKSADQFRESLNRSHLRVSGSHVGLDALEADFNQVVADAKVLGTEWVIVPWVSPDRRNWAELAKTLSGFGEALAAVDLRLAYHNHDFEFGPDNGLRTLVAMTHPLLVNFQIDVGWVRFAGHDPGPLLWELGPRAPLVHLKDMDPQCENPHVVAGDGAVQWDAVLAACEGVGIEFGAIEMDAPPNNPLDDVRACVRFFHEHGLG